jgi:hypothetical protein
MVNSALFAFSAADSIIYASRTLSNEYNKLAMLHVLNAFKNLKQQLSTKWPHCQRGSFMPIMVTIFMLAAHGVCISYLVDWVDIPLTMSYQCRSAQMTQLS